jgi:hypothetical protein
MTASAAGSCLAPIAQTTDITCSSHDRMKRIEPRDSMLVHIGHMGSPLNQMHLRDLGTGTSPQYTNCY